MMLLESTLIYNFVEKNRSGLGDGFAQLSDLISVKGLIFRDAIEPDRV